MTNRKLFEEFLNKNLNNIYRFAYSYTKDIQSAEDIVSESIIKALSSIDKLKKQDFMKTWFYKIIINTYITNIKKEKKQINNYNKKTDLSENIFDDYSHITLNEFIEKLDEKYKTIIILRYFEDMTIEEISKIIDKNINTTKSRLYKALKILKIEMEEYK